MNTWNVQSALAAVRARMFAACERVGRDVSSVTLVAVSKRQSLAAMRAAYALGQRDFGENYVQELVRKADALAALPDIRWHLIGRLQSNKVKDVVRIGCTVHTLDSVRTAELLDKRASAAGKNLPVLIQVNLADESQKAGVGPSDVAPLAAAVRAMPSLTVCGLMAIPNVDASVEQSRTHFANLRALAEQVGLLQLSMGMSHDFELAIEEGATMVRVGTAIFGERR